MNLAEIPDFVYLGLGLFGFMEWMLRRSPWRWSKYGYPNTFTTHAWIAAVSFLIARGTV